MPRLARAPRRIIDSDDDEDDILSSTMAPVKAESPVPISSVEDDLTETSFQRQRPPASAPARRVTRSARSSLASTAEDSEASFLTAAPVQRSRTKKPSVKTESDYEDTESTMMDTSHQQIPSKSTTTARKLASRSRKPAPSQHDTSILSQQNNDSVLVEADASTLNQQPPPSSRNSSTSSNNSNESMIVKPIKAMDTILEKPMDIMMNSRNADHTLKDEHGDEKTSDNTPKPRIVITQLLLTNFKSYAGQQMIGPFHSSFSSVVGPNGSGKSNVIDSLLFVFGFRASKMRQGKISALIHSSSQHPNLEYCEVAVHFQEVIDVPNGAPQVVPNSKLVVSRKAFKNNASKYYINGSESNFTIVTNLLRDRGIDLDHKRFLILQGEVESIAQMKPKAVSEHDDGLLEYLEDIIGTSKYKTPIEEAVVEVESLNEVCMEKNGRVQHVEKEKKSLEEKKDKALAYIHDENDLVTKKAALHQIHMAESEDKLAATQESMAKLQAELQIELDKHAGSANLIKELEDAYANGTETYNAVEKESKSVSKQLAKLEQERVKLDEKHKFLSEKQTKLEKTLETAASVEEEATQSIATCTEDVATRTEALTELEGQVETEEAELANIRESLQGKTQKYSDQIAEKQKSLEPWMAKINQKQSAMAVAESELHILRDKMNAGSIAVLELESKASTIEEEMGEKKAQLQKLLAEKKSLEAEAAEITTELQELKSKEPKVRMKISGARQKAEEARSNLSKSQAQGQVMSALTRMKDSGRISGFHGRLGNLGTIDGKFDIAISTACPALDNFVTETVDAGQQCIEYLRKNNLGRGNFICLDKLRTRDLSAIETPEDVPRLFDLIKPKDERFRAAFYHALQDTLVARDLQQANRIAYGAKRWRVVTLAGELIDKTGTMSGGGAIVKRGLMSSKLTSDVSLEQVEKLEQDRDTLEEKFKEFTSYVSEQEERLRQLHELIPASDIKMQKISLELGSAQRNLDDVHRRIQEVQKEQQPSDADHARMDSLETDIAKLQQEVDKLHQGTAAVEEEIKALQDKIMEVGGERLRAQRAKVDDLKRAITMNQEAISQAEVKIAKCEQQIAKSRKDRAKAEKEVAKAAPDLQKLMEQVNAQEEKTEALKEQAEAADHNLRMKKRELTQLKSELDEKMAALNETRAVEIEMRNRLEQYEKLVVDIQRAYKHAEDKLSKLELQNVADLMGEGGGLDEAEEEGEDEEEQEDDVGEEEESEEEEEEEEEQVNEEGEEDDDEMDLDDDEEKAFDLSSKSNKSKTKKKGPRKSISIKKAKKRFLTEVPRYSRDELADMSKETLKEEIAELEEKIQDVQVDLGVLAEYRRRVSEHAARASDLATAIAQRDAAKKRCDDLRRLRLEGFMRGFGAISMRLKEMYQMITMGGNAELELVDSLDPFSEGILFSVMPPKKSWKNISNLSGGEKTLSSLALVFALHHYKPTPLYVMDEIDAALDFRNVSIVANYIKERTKNAQFIVISLRNNMFELAARLVGVYKVNHMTKCVAIDNDDFLRVNAAPPPQPPRQGQQRPPQQQQHQQPQPQQKSRPSGEDTAIPETGRTMNLVIR